MNKAFSTRLRAIVRVALIGAGCGIALAAQAQTSTSGNGREPIVVQGERLSRQAAHERALGFVRTTGVASGETPAARWVDPVCPDVVGLVESAERAAEARIRRIAASIGAPVAPEGCERNIVITFAPDGAALARQIAQVAPRRLSQLTPSAREQVTTGAAPIRWWYTTDVRGRHGSRSGEGAGGAGGTDQSVQGGGYGARLGGTGLMHYESSVVSTLTNRVITSAIVIIDEDEVMGRRLDSLADYAALVALAEIRGVGATPEGSVLSMFTAPDAARNLTPQDIAFLRALYHLSLDRQAMQHRGALIGGIADALAGNP